MTTHPPQRQRLGWPWKVAAAFLAVILLIGAVTVGMNYLRPESETAPGLPDLDGAAASEPAPRDPIDPAAATKNQEDGAKKGVGTDGACDLPVGDQSVPTGSPDARWELIEGTGLPLSDEFGPHAQEGEARVCYPRNPTGALFAAANILPRVYTNGDVRARQVTSGAMRDQIDAEGQPDPSEATSVQIVGYRVENFAPDRTDMVIVGRQPDGLIAVPLGLVWEDGDWKIDGSNPELQPPYEVQSLVGFTEWGAP